MFGPESRDRMGHGPEVIDDGVAFDPQALFDQGWPDHPRVVGELQEVAADRARKSDRKLVGLLAITSPGGVPSLGTRATAHRWIEWSGRFGMLDVLLVALLVAWVKFGDLFQVHPGPGALAFTACVLASLLASAWFDPHALWDEAPR